MKRLVAVMFTFAAIGCADTVPAEDAAVSDTTAVTQPVGNTLNPNLLVDAGWLTAHRSEPNTAVLFVGGDSLRTDAERFGNAWVLPVSALSETRDGVPNELLGADSLREVLRRSGVRDNAQIVLVGAPLAAARAFVALDYFGLSDQVALLQGGLPAARALPPVEPIMSDDADHAPLTPAVRTDMIVDADWVQSHLQDTSVVILDARPHAQYTGEEPGEGITTGGHIPGALNLFWEDLLLEPGSSELKAPEALRAQFEAAGVGPGKTIVVYCRTGGQASFLYFVARYLGYDVKLYEGSFVDWAGRGLPVETT